MFIVMAIGCYIPISSLGHAVRMVHLPSGYWPFLIVTLLCYCLLTQLSKRVYIWKFNEWL